MKTKLNIINANSWLFIELVIITIAAWVVFDPSVVNLYYRSLPLGYDTSRLLYAETETNTWNEAVSQEDWEDPYKATEERQSQMLRQLMAADGVESVYLYNSHYNSMAYTNIGYTGCGTEGDTLYLPTIKYVTDAHFFETYGLKPLPGSPSAEELSLITQTEQKVVLTRSAAITLFGTADVVGRSLTICYQPSYVVTVAAVVEDFRMSVPSSQRSVVIMPAQLESTSCQYLIRLKPDVDTRRYVEEHARELMRSGQTDFNRICRLMTYNDHLRQMELDGGRTQEVNRSLALAFFFLVNLCLAVIGTVWLHAKRRTEECGVRRSYGATRPRLLWSFLAQNAVLATVAVLVGLVIFLNYAYSGLIVEDGEESFETLYSSGYYELTTSDKTWADSFWSHFLVVSAVVYLIILITVLIGTAIPAVKIIKTKITDALRDE